MTNFAMYSHSFIIIILYLSTNIRNALVNASTQIHTPLPSPVTAIIIHSFLLNFSKELCLLLWQMLNIIQVNWLNIIQSVFDQSVLNYNREHSNILQIMHFQLMFWNSIQIDWLICSMNKQPIYMFCVCQDWQKLWNKKQK